MEKKLRGSLLYLVVLTLIITVVFTFIICFNFSFWGKIDWGVTGQVGDFFGGIVGTLIGAIGFILIYLSFVSQTDSRKEQEEQFLTSQIESRFFELIKLHKENVNDIIFNPDGKNELKGRKAIDFIYKQIESCYKELNLFFESNTVEKVYKEDYLAKIQCYCLVKPDLCLLNLARIDITYSIVFFGTNPDLQALKRLLSKFYDENFLTLVFRFISLKPLSDDLTNIWDIINKKGLTLQEIEDAFQLLDEYNSKDKKTLKEICAPEEPYLKAIRQLSTNDKLNRYYGGHQYKLGHYFRHLFQTVKYIDTKGTLSYQEKYDYIKTLRAQLSTIEQYLVFFNSVSFMGRPWEFENIVEGNLEDNDTNKWLITKYNFIKNIPDLYPFEDVLVVNNYYPQVNFEFESKPSSRIGLERIFK